MDKLGTFNKTLSTCKIKFESKLPLLVEFQNSNEWKVLNKLAIEVNKDIK